METIIVKPERSWPERNWGWLVAASIASLVIFFASIILLLLSLLQNSDATKLAIKTAKSSPVLVEQIGSPMKIGWIISGNIDVTPETGSAKLSIPVSGPKGLGTLDVEAHKRAGQWHLDLLEFEKDDSSIWINLLPAETALPTVTQ